MVNKRSPSWRRNLKERSLIYGLGAVLIGLAFWVTFQFVEPAPPRTLSIATGSSEGAYWRFAHSLKAELAQHDVELTVVSTDGSVENLSQLSQNQVDIAFIQSGVAQAEDYPQLQGLGALYYEPLWIFTQQGPNAVKRINELEGLRVAIGGAGSGTRLVAERLFAFNQVNQSQLILSNQSGSSAVQALLNGEIDILMSVASISAPMIQQLLMEEGIALVSLDRAPAYSRRAQWLTELTLPEGVIDLSRNLPAEEVKLLAVNATLVGTEDLHPALRDLLLQGIEAVFSGGTLLSGFAEFPRVHGGDFQVDSATERYYQQGPPFLQRYLPFWVANLIDRLKLLALPLFALMLPLSKILPPAYQWTVRKKIYRWYDEVQEIDQMAGEEQTLENLSQYHLRLTEIEQDVRDIEVPLSYAHELYSLRLHLDLLQSQIAKRLNAA